MVLLKSILAASLLCFAPGLSQAAEAVHSAAGGAAEHAASGLPPAAPLIELGPLRFTNSMLVTWMVALLLIVFAQTAMRNPKLVPSGLQNFCEWLVDGLYTFFEEILGHALVKKSFWFFASIFLFILFTNWFGLIPGVGTIGWGTPDAQGHFHLTRPILRGGNADLNMVSAMALLFFFLWTVWSLQELGVKGFIKHIFGGESGGGGFMGLFLGLVFIVVGLIEVISIFFRPVSLSFRLYGNIFAGENILEAMMHLVPWLGWILPLPFYFLEMLVGLVQALVFALLTAVFTALMCGQSEAHGTKDAHGTH